MHATHYIIRLSVSTSDQKLYTELWLSPLSFCFWLHHVNSRFKSHLDNKSKERFYSQSVCKSKGRRTKTVDKDIFIKHKFSDRNFSQPIITISDLPQEQGIGNNSASSLFYKQIEKWHEWKAWVKQQAGIKFIEVFYIFPDHINLFDNFC